MSKKKEKWCKEAKLWFAVAVSFTFFLVTALLFLAYVCYNGAKHKKEYVEVRYYNEGEQQRVYLPDTQGLVCKFYTTPDGSLWIDYIDPRKPEEGVKTVRLPGKSSAVKVPDGYDITFYEYQEHRVE